MDYAIKWEREEKNEVYRGGLLKIKHVGSEVNEFLKNDPFECRAKTEFRCLQHENKCLSDINNPIWPGLARPNGWWAALLWYSNEFGELDMKLDNLTVCYVIMEMRGEAFSQQENGIDIVRSNIIND